MPLKCYTRQRNDGSNYVSCEKGEKPKKAPVKKPAPVHTLAKPRRIGAVARPKAIKRPGAQHKGTGGARMGAVYKKPAPKKAENVDYVLHHKFLKEHEFKTKAQETKFKQIHDAYKEQKTMNRVDGKSVKITIKGNKITIKYGFLMVDDMYSDPPKFTDTISVFNLNAKSPSVSKKEVSKKTEQWEFKNVNTPLDITKSAKIKKLIKDFIGENNTLKMPSKDIQHITKKAILNVSDYTDDEIVKKYKKLPKNIKDNLALVFYSYGKELHTKYSHLKGSPGANGRPFYRFYNP